MKTLSRDKILEHLFSLKGRGTKKGFERMAEAAGRCNNPGSAYRSIHVAGTNGKGTACAIIESVLRSHGFKTGLFTSPHLVEFEERIIVNGRPVRSDEWIDAYEKIYPLVGDLEPGFFEITLCVCFELFKRAGVEYAVFETGMGGRHDATNVLAPVVSVITGIQKDHMRYLGEDLAAIAGEKLGIVKNGVPLVMAAPPEDEIREMAVRACAEHDAPLRFVSISGEQDIDVSPAGTAFTWKGMRFHLPLAGAHQAGNALCALEALSIASPGCIASGARGMAGVSLPGRFQIADAGPKKIIFDIAHNSASIAALERSVKHFFPDQKIVSVAGIMNDKEIAPMLGTIARMSDSLVLTAPAMERACPAHSLAKFLPEPMPCPHDVIPRVSGAVRRALERPEEIVCVTGSCFTVGEAMTALDIRPYGLPRKYP